MKQCPVCKTTYPDETLKFCLADGANLLTVSDEEKTIQMSADRNPLRIDFQNEPSAQTHFAPTIAPVQATKKGCRPLLVGGLLALLFLAFGGIAAAIYLFAPFGAKNTANSMANTTPTVTPSPKSDSNSDEINAKIANLEKQLQAQKNQKQTANIQPAPTRTIQIPTTNYETATATVAPTGDGFLSLRTEPSTKTGVQLVKIPTGATVTLTGKCQIRAQSSKAKPAVGV